ncbi:MAG: hypothetical protein ABJC62_13375 [Frankiaceae bacterium]
MDTATLDRAVAELAAAKGRWAHLSIPVRIAYLHRVRSGVAEVAEEWVAAAVAAKEIRPGSPLEGEEWISGPYAVLTWIAAVTETLQAVAAGADPLAGYPVRTRSDGQVVVPVYPHGLVERLLLHGFTAEVWLEPGAAVEAAGAYRRPAPAGRWRWCSAPATLPRSRRSTCSPSSTPTAKWWSAS